MNKEKRDCRLKQCKNYMLKKHQHHAVYLAIFVLLFFGGFRFNSSTAFFISLLNIFFIIFLVHFFNRIFDKNGFKFRIPTYFWLAFLLFLFVNIVVTIEYSLWKYIFYKDVIKWYENIRRWFPHVMLKDIFIVLGSFIASLINSFI